MDMICIVSRASKDVLATEDVHLGDFKTYPWPTTEESANPEEVQRRISQFGIE